jgi:Flp pilus assembly protein TadG
VLEKQEKNGVNALKENRTRSSDWIAGERGSVAIMVAVSIAALFAFAALAIDGAILMTTRTQLHAAADAAALAGASALVNGTEEDAINRAINFASYNKAYQVGMDSVFIQPEDITFPEENVIRVTTHRTTATGDPLRTFFLRILDPKSNNTSDMTAVAVAKAYDVCSSHCLKPWAIPDRWNDANHNGVFDGGDYYNPDVTGYNAPGDVGQIMVVKMGDPHHTIAPGQYFPVDYPPLDKYPGEDPLTGAKNYRRFIYTCEEWIVEPGDRLQLEPGGKVGPTIQGVQELIAQDPGAWWDSETRTVVGSAFTLSPRIGLIPFLDPRQPPSPGRNWVTVVKLGAFFIESVGPGSQVNARFIQITTQGPPCPGGTGNSFIKTIALVE